MATTKNQQATVVGVFLDTQQAQQAVAELRRAGFREDQIGVISHDRGKTATTATSATDTGSNVAAGAATGAAAGAGVGALWALGIAAGMLPAIGPVIAGGLLASVLASAAGGAAVAGLVGALIGLGIPEEEAHYYEGEFRSGRTIVTVRADERYNEAWTILHRCGAYNRTNAAAGTTTSRASVTAAAVAGGSQTMKLHEEELHARKQPVETGEVRLRKDVVTENKTLTVPVTREEVVVERRAVSGAPVAGDVIKAGDEIRIPVKEEQVYVEKRPVVKEEVTVGKRAVQDTQQVSGSVRREELKVEEQGDVEVQEKGKGRKGSSKK